VPDLQRGLALGRGIGDPFGDGGEGPRPGQDGGRRDRQDRGQRVADAASPPRIGNLPQVIEQAGVLGSDYRHRAAGHARQVVQGRGDRQ
jgi:hypothetical protein